MSTEIDRRFGLVGSAGLKLPVRVYSDSTIALTGVYTLQSVTLAAGDRVAMFDGTVSGGIYIVDTGDWRRSPDFDGLYDVVRGTQFNVLDGTWANYTLYVTNTGTITFDTTIVTVNAAKSNGLYTKKKYSKVYSATTTNPTETLGFSYTIGTESLDVFLNGQRINRDIVEASTTTITISGTVNEGDELDVFSYVQPISETMPAENVGFQNDVSDSSPQSVDDVLQQIYSPKTFNAVGDGISDDILPLQYALDNSNGKVVNLFGKTYKATGGLIGYSDYIIENGTIDFTTLPTDGRGLYTAGSLGTPQNLTSDTNGGTFAANVASTTDFTVDGWAWLQSDGYFSPPAVDNVKCGELVRIKSKTSTQLKFYGACALRYATADSAVVFPINGMSNITFRNVTFRLPVSTGDQAAFEFQYCNKVLLDNCRTSDCDYAHMVFYRCADVRCIGGSQERTGVQEGLDYGVVYDGCYNVTTDGVMFNSMRHGTTTGGSQGVSRFIKTINCHIYNPTDGGIDSHAACIEHQFNYNTIHFSDDSDTEQDGIISQAAIFQCHGNIIRGSRRAGISWQPLFSKTNYTGFVVASINEAIITGNKNVSGTASGIEVSTGTFTNAADIHSLYIGMNDVSSFDDMVLITANTGSISRVSLVGGASSDTAGFALRGVHLNAVSSHISWVNISNIYSKVASPYENFHFQGTGSSAKVKNVSVTNCTTDGGDYGARGTWCDNIQFSNMNYVNVSLGETIFDANSTNIQGDGRINYQLVTGTTVTLSQDRLLYEEVEFATSATCTVTISGNPRTGAKKRLWTRNAQIIQSASSNVTPMASGTAGTAILPATAKTWCDIRWDGTTWKIIASGTGLA